MTIRLAGITAAIGLATAIASSVLRIQIVIPAVVHPTSYGDLVFLGSILAAPPVPGQTPSHASSVAAPPPEAPMIPRDALQPFEAGTPPQMPAGRDPTPIRLLPPRLFETEKQFPHAISTVVEPPRITSMPVWIRGPARRRELMERPPLAPYLNRVPLTRLRSQTTPSTVELELRFILTLDGRVSQAEILRSSGDPLLDLVGLQYLKDWRFAPVDPRDVRKHTDSWGRVVLRLGLEPR